jgi:hypothetical protein
VYSIQCGSALCGGRVCVRAARVTRRSWCGRPPVVCAAPTPLSCRHCTPLSYATQHTCSSLICPRTRAVARPAYLRSNLSQSLNTRDPPQGALREVREHARGGWDADEGGWEVRVGASCMARLLVLHFCRSCVIGTHARAVGCTCAHGGGPALNYTIVNVCQVGDLGGPVGRRSGDRVASDASMVRRPRRHRVCIAAAAVARREREQTSKYGYFHISLARWSTSERTPLRPPAAPPSVQLLEAFIYI